VLGDDKVLDGEAKRVRDDIGVMYNPYSHAGVLARGEVVQ
jgi:hypothetical protein